jgi:hypothetical protein
VTERLQKRFIGRNLIEQFLYREKMVGEDCLEVLKRENLIEDFSYKIIMVKVIISSKNILQTDKIWCIVSCVGRQRRRIASFLLIINKRGAETP